MKSLNGQITFSFLLSILCKTKHITKIISSSTHYSNHEIKIQLLQENNSNKKCQKTKSKCVESFSVNYFVNHRARNRRWKSGEKCGLSVRSLSDPGRKDVAHVDGLNGGLVDVGALQSFLDGKSAEPRGCDGGQRSEKSLEKISVSRKQEKRGG